jgi:hypothetical protein
VTGVPIQLILNANPTFVRGEDVHNGLKALALDIRQFGLQQKVLLDPDYQIIDGARRVLACQMLGMTEIPAVSTGYWPHIYEHMVATRKVEASLGIAPVPLKWAQLADWYNRILKPLAMPYERARAIETRRAKRLALRTDNGMRSQTAREVTEMIGGGVSSNRLIEIQRVASTLARIKREAPELYESSAAYAVRAEAAGEAPSRVTIQLSKFLKERSVTSSTLADRKVAEEQIAMISKAASLLSVISPELTLDLNLAISPEEAAALFKLLHPHVRQLAVLRRELSVRGGVRVKGNIT